LGRIFWIAKTTEVPEKHLKFIAEGPRSLIEVFVILGFFLPKYLVKSLVALEARSSFSKKSIT
jgi:hypothetical protein